MKYVILLIIVPVLGSFSLQASEENNYWLKIEELSKKDTPQGNPELAKHLKSLTKEQLLTALRQYCKSMEGKSPTEMEWAEVTAMRILVCYAEPLKRSALSDEEFRKMRRGKQRNLEAGLVPARFTKEAFEKVIAGIADRKEGTYFRYTLLDIFRTKEFYPVLSKLQKERFLDTCLAVLNDRATPDKVRSKCIDVMSRIFQREYLQTIYADDVVKELHRTNTDMQLSSLIRSGEAKLTAKTREQLAPLRRRIQDLRKKLADLLEDEREPKSLKKEAKRQLYRLDRLPLINAKDPAPKN